MAVERVDTPGGTIVLFVAVPPQFVDPTRGRSTAQLLILGAVFLCLALMCDGVWTVAAWR